MGGRLRNIVVSGSGLAALLGVSGGCQTTPERSDEPQAVLAYRVNDTADNYLAIKNIADADGRIDGTEAQRLLDATKNFIIRNQEFRNFCMTNQSVILHGHTMQYFIRIIFNFLKNFWYKFFEFKKIVLFLLIDWVFVWMQWTFAAHEIIFYQKSLAPRTVEALINIFIYESSIINFL